MKDTTYDKNYRTRSKNLNTFTYEQIVEKFQCFMEELIYLPMAYTTWDDYSINKLAKFAEENSLDEITKIIPIITSKRLHDHYENFGEYDDCEGCEEKCDEECEDFGKKNEILTKISGSDLGYILLEDKCNGFLLKVRHPVYDEHEDGFIEYTNECANKWLYGENLDELLWKLLVYLESLWKNNLDDPEYYTPYSSDKDFEMPYTITKYNNIIEKISTTNYPVVLKTKEQIARCPTIDLADHYISANAELYDNDGEPNEETEVTEEYLEYIGEILENRSVPEEYAYMADCDGGVYLSDGESVNWLTYRMMGN